MSDAKDKPAPTPPREGPGNPAGRVRHDKSGRAIWEWAVDTGRHALDSTSRLLKRLDNPSLSLEEDAKKKEREKQAAEAASAGRQVPTFGSDREADPLASRRGSFNPYDNRGTPPPRTVLPPKPGSKPTPRPAPRSTDPAPDKPGLLSRLFGGKR